MKNNNYVLKKEILDFINVFEKDEQYKDIRQYFTIENNFFNLYNRQLYLYIRVSTDSQDFGRQIIQIYKWLKRKGISVCIDNIYCDKFTGKILNRKDYQEVRKLIKKNDYLLISNLNRLGRGNVENGYEKIKEEWNYYKSHNINLLIFDDELGDFISDALPFENQELSLNLQFMKDIMLHNAMYKDCLKILEVSSSTKNGLEKIKVTGSKTGQPIGRPRIEKSTKENFIKTLEYMLINNVGQFKAAFSTNYPTKSFQNDLKKCYEKYKTKDYKTILDNLKEDNAEW